MSYKTVVDKAWHRKLKIEQHEPHWKPGVNSGRVGSGTLRVTIFKPGDKSEMRKGPVNDYHSTSYQIISRR